MLARTVLVSGMMLLPTLAAAQPDRGRPPDAERLVREAEQQAREAEKDRERSRPWVWVSVAVAAALGLWLAAVPASFDAVLEAGRRLQGYSLRESSDARTGKLWMIRVAGVAILVLGVWIGLLEASGR